MSITALLLISGIILFLAYRIYGKFVANRLAISDTHSTPAHDLNDGIDYVPSKPAVVLGHHFASIAGAGPIVGPIIAITFGWVPAVIWILIGGIFFGGVHDITAMVASLRHKGKSIGTIIHQYIGDTGKFLFLIFSISTLILIIAVFADIVSKTFVDSGEAASSSIQFLILAIAFGFVLRRNPSKTQFRIYTTIAVLIMYGMIFAGNALPVNMSYNSWIFLLLIYAFIASITPVNIILQPRDFLNSFLLYGLMIFGVLGIVISNPEIKMSSDVIIRSESLGYIFPVLFVTVACGAISGFHSLVASGTTSKQLDKETDAKVVGYGGMLIESFLAVMSVCAVIILDRGDYVTKLGQIGPVPLFSNGLGGMIAALGIPTHIAITFVALTVSAFALTTLDTCARLARYAVQELCENQSSPILKTVSSNRFIATVIPLLLSFFLLKSGESAVLWPIFGSANQLLAALALLAITVWLHKTGVNALFTLIPMVFMFVVTLSSLFWFAYENFMKNQLVLGILATLLSILSITLIVLARKSLKRLLAENK